MRIKMLKTQLGSPNGIRVQKYSEGQEYEIVEELGKVFLKMKVCSIVKDNVEKAKKISPTNKMEKLSPNNKKVDDYSDIEKILNENDDD